MKRSGVSAALALLIVASGQPPLLPVPRASAQTGTPAAAEPYPVDSDRGATRAPHRWDGYDVGAVAVNIVWVPVKIGTCAISGGLGAAVYVVTLGAARDWSASAFHEGCVDKWLIDGDDLRPIPRTRDGRSNPM